MAKVIGMDKTKAKVVTCYCGAIVEYMPNEVETKVEDEPYGGGTDTYNYLTCPNCNKRMRWC